MAVGHYTVALILLLVPLACPAGQWALQINAVSHHPARNDLNERNTGLGLQYTTADATLVTRYALGTLTNSMGDRTWYAGAAYGPRLGERDFYVSPAVFLGVLTYPSSGRSLLPAALPVLTIGSGPVALNAIYVPEIGDKTAAAVLFQVTLRLR